MLFRQVLLVFSALITLAYSFPSGPQHNNTIDFVQNVSNVSDAEEDKNPLTVTVEDKNPKSESVVVEFVYKNNNGENTIDGIKGTDNNKYSVDSSSNSEKMDKIKNPKEKNKEKLVQKLNTEDTAEVHINEPVSDSSYTSKNFQIKAATSLIPEEVSPLSGKWPTLFYEVFNPILPFPELQYNKPKQINTQKVQSENADAYLSYYEKERKEPANVAGPLLSPLSIYDREFNVPIFD